MELFHWPPVCAKCGREISLIKGYSLSESIRAHNDYCYAIQFTFIDKIFARWRHWNNRRKKTTTPVKIDMNVMDE